MADEIKNKSTVSSLVKKITIVIALGIATVTASYTCGATHPFQIDVGDAPSAAVVTTPTTACSSSSCPPDAGATQSHDVLDAATATALDAASD